MGLWGVTRRDIAELKRAAALGYEKNGDPETARILRREARLVERRDGIGPRRRRRGNAQ